MGRTHRADEGADVGMDEGTPVTEALLRAGAKVTIEVRSIGVAEATAAEEDNAAGLENESAFE